MIRIWTMAAAAGGFAAVVAGTAAAHLAAAGGPAAGLLRTGAFYAMAHAAALLGVAALGERRTRPGAGLAAAGWCFAFGLLVFSFSLYALAATGLSFFGYITPFGGLGLIAGWAALGIDAAIGRR